MFPWHHMIDEAATPEMVLVLARDYLACWPEEDLELIPEAARPARVESGEDIAFWHRRLVECYRAGAAMSHACGHLRSMLHFFACASLRLEQLQGAPLRMQLDDVPVLDRMLGAHLLPANPEPPRTRA